jgi:hypothetical protein
MGMHNIMENDVEQVSLEPYTYLDNFLFSSPDLGTTP